MLKVFPVRLVVLAVFCSGAITLAAVAFVGDRLLRWRSLLGDDHYLATMLMLFYFFTAARGPRHPCEKAERIRGVHAKALSAAGWSTGCRVWRVHAWQLRSGGS